MKRDENIFNYGHAIRHQAIRLGSVPSPVSLEKPYRPSEGEDTLLKIVYALDPISKLPTGDLNYLCSDSVNPEVRAWILANLQFDTSSAALPAAPKDLSDDDIILLARNPHESVQSYIERVNTYAKTNLEFIERVKAKVSMEQSKSVSSESEGSAFSSE